MSKESFNPVKEEKDGAKARRVIWSTKALDAALKGLDEGRRLIANPFYDNNPRLLKRDLVFKHTKEELEEWQRCCNDIIYFANKYCKLMTPEGIKKIVLRDYQEEYLKHLMEHDMSILLSSRQAGKCVSLITKVLVKLNEVLLEVKPLEKYRIIDNIYNVPLFELYNLFDQSKQWKIKYKLYKRIYEGCCLSKECLKTISLLDKLKQDSQKIVECFSTTGVEVMTDTGFQEVSEINLTKPLPLYHLTLEDGTKLECADNHIVFKENMDMVYVQDLKSGIDLIQTDHGTVKVVEVSRSDIEICMCDLSVYDFNNRYYTNGILSHNTTTSSIFILHFILFNIDKNVLILGNRYRTSKDILDKFKEIYYQLPFFLKPGVVKWNEAEVCLDNGCKIKAESTTEKSGIGMSIHCCLMDEFAHVAPNILDKFYNNLLPVIAGTKGRVLITSTQNGYNLFYRLWMAAKQHLNDYWPFEVTWDMIPEWNPDKKCWEKRDEAWHQRQIANYGSEEAFNQQFGTDFDVNANTLIDSKILKKKQHDAIEFVNKDLYGVSNSQYFFWKPDYEPMEDLRKDFITVTIDIAEGGGGDFTIFNFNHMTEKGDEVVGFFRANTVNIEQATLTLMEIAIKYLHPDHHCISLEYNTYGELFVKCIRENRDKYSHVSDFDESNFVKYYNEAMTSYRIGIKLTSATKSVGCKLFKEQYEKGIIENQSTIFLAEMENFSDSKGNDTYAATFGHDDEVMASIQLVHAKQSNAYKYLRSEFDSCKPDKEQKEIPSGVSQAELDKMNAGEYFDPTKVFPSFNSMDDIYNSISQRNSNPYASDLSRLSRFS